MKEKKHIAFLSSFAWISGWSAFSGVRTVNTINFFLRIYLSRSCCKRTQVVFVLIKREQPEPRIKIAIQECALKKNFHLYLSELRTSFLEDQTKNKNKETSNDKYAHVYRKPCDHCSLTSSFWSCLEFPYSRIAFFIIYFLLFLWKFLLVFITGST